MSQGVDRLNLRLRELRTSFDRSFAEPSGAPAQAHLDFLAMTVAGCPYAIRVAEISALHTDRSITPLPGDAPHLLGIAGFRGALVAVYDLAGVLGQPRPAEARWLVLCREKPVAFAIEAFEGYLRVPERDVAGEANATVLCVETIPRPVISLPSLVDAIERRTLGGVLEEHAHA